MTEQLRQICYSGCTNILEVGIGKGLLKHFLKPFPQINHTGIDIATDLNPDVVGSVTEMPFKNNQFDMVMCGQVLEHLPFSLFPKALSEIRRVSSHKAIISLPDKRRHFGFAICFARYGWKNFEWNPARLKNLLRTFEFTGSHYWEIGCKNSTNGKNISCMKNTGFVIEQQYRLQKHAWHCFFLLNCNKGVAHED